MNLTFVKHVASLWHPIMLAQERGELSEQRACELLGISVLDYRQHKEQTIQAVVKLVESLPSALISVLDIMRDQPESFTSQSVPCESNTSGTERKGESQSTNQKSLKG